MKLNIVPASQGLTWVKLGISTFFKQPLALGGLFFMFMAAVSVASLIPVLGTLLAIAIVPAATLGLMVATLEALRGKFPMPSVLATAFRAGRERMVSMMILGLLYAGCLGLLLGFTTLFDGGKFAKLYIGGVKITSELVNAPDFQTAMLVGTALYIPLSLLFWHAPALVHWHGIHPVKALFFSLVACLRNFWAYFMYGLGWMLVMMAVGLLVTVSAALIGAPGAAGLILMPMILLTAAMFFSSIYFTFRDSFVHDEETNGSSPASNS
jgi:hypothetical protein